MFPPWKNYFYFRTFKLCFSKILTTIFLDVKVLKHYRATSEWYFVFVFITLRHHLTKMTKLKTFQIYTFFYWIWKVQRWNVTRFPQLAWWSKKNKIAKIANDSNLIILPKLNLKSTVFYLHNSYWIYK